MLIGAISPPGRAPAAAQPIALLAPTGTPPLLRGPEPRGALIIVEAEVYVGPAPQPQG